MSTRSNIGILRKNGSVDVIYCHWDGYLRNNGDILLNYYKDNEKVNKLIELGDISCLEINVEPTTKEHSYDAPEGNVTVAYGRDRGESNVDFRHFESLDNYLKQVDKLFIEYIYLYNEENGSWYYTDKTYDRLQEKKDLIWQDFELLTQEKIDEEGKDND